MVSYYYKMDSAQQMRIFVLKLEDESIILNNR